MPKETLDLNKIVSEKISSAETEQMNLISQRDALIKKCREFIERLENMQIESGDADDGNTPISKGSANENRMKTARILEELRRESEIEGALVKKIEKRLSEINTRIKSLESLTPEKVENN